MKHYALLFITALLLLCCTTNVNAQTDADTKIRTAIRNYLLGRSGGAILTASAKKDLVESTWPEVQCSKTGDLDSPEGFKNLTVKRVAPGKYKYSCVCPIHGDKFTDFTTISAYLGKDGKVRITHVTWDDFSTQSFSSLMSSSTWHTTEYGFRIPNFFTPSSEIFVEEMPGSFQRWTSDDVCVACWPGLGSWAVTDYPAARYNLTEDVLIKNVTYSNGTGTVFSGYASDGRIWYMKKKVIEGREVDHASVLVIIYPKSMQSDVKQLIDIVKGW